MTKLEWFTKSVAVAMTLFAAGQPASAAVDISDEAGLRAISNNLAEEYNITADIALTGDWTPIGSNAQPFTGKINGNGHVISGLRVHGEQVARNAFIHSASGATISRLGLDDVDILGNEDVGAIVGKDKGNNVISECYVSGKISGRDHVGALVGGSESPGNSVIENCYALAYVHGRDCQAGGLVGTPVDLTVRNSYFAGTIYATGNCVGGIGALIDGGSFFEVSNSFAAVPLLLRANASWGGEGRIIGNYGGRTARLTNNYGLDSTKRGEYSAMRAVNSSDANSQDGANKSYAELTSPQFIYETLGWSDAIWSAADNVLPRLKWQTVPAGVSKVLVLYAASEQVLIKGDEVTVIAGTLPNATYASSDEAVATVDASGVVTAHGKGDATITVEVAADDTHGGVAATKVCTVTVNTFTPNITTADELDAMRYKLDGEYTLMNDIDLSGIENFQPIGSRDKPFKGKLNGNGHVIKNLTMSVTGDNQGFFGAAEGAVIEKVGFENADVRWSGNGGQNIAVVVGRSVATTITNSYVANSYVYGRDHVASFVGGSEKMATRPPTLIEDCYSSAMVATQSYQVGGIMGTMINAHINRCHFSGYVKAPGTNSGAFVSLIDNEANTNAVTNSICLAGKLEGGNVGRIIGNLNGKGNTMTNNYALETTICGGGFNVSDATTTGKQGENVTVEQAKSEAFYAGTLGWDMAGTWKLYDGIYPVLAWQATPVSGTFFGVPESVTLIEKPGFDSFALEGIFGNLGQACEIHEIDTDYLEITNNVVTVKGWPDDKLTTAIMFASGADAVTANVEMPVFIVSEASSKIKISTADDLVEAANNPTFDYTLTADIDMEGVSFDGIGTADHPYTGTFNGNGYFISNITRVANDNKKGALFNVTDGATIKNLGLENVNIKGDNKQDIGGLVGKARNTTVDQCYVSGVIEGNDHIGSFFGGCENSSISNSYANIAVITRGYQAGGLSGVASGLKIENSYVTGSVTSTNKSWPGRSAGIIGMLESGGSSMKGVGCMADIAGGTTGRFVGTANTYNDRLDEFTSCVYSSEKAFERGEGNGTGSTVCYEECTEGEWINVPRVSESDARSEAELASWSTYEAMGWDSEIWKMPATHRSATLPYPVLAVLKADIPTGVESVSVGKASVVICGGTGAIEVANAGDAVVNVYNFAGLLVGSCRIYGHGSVEVAPAGYIVTVANADGVATAKVMVR